MWYVRDVLYAVLYVRVSCFVVCGCGVRRYVDVCYCESVVNVYLDQSSVLCILIVEGCLNVMLSLMSVMSPPPALFTAVKLCILGVLAGVSLVS